MRVKLPLMEKVVKEIGHEDDVVGGAEFGSESAAGEEREGDASGAGMGRGDFENTGKVRGDDFAIRRGLGDSEAEETMAGGNVEHLAGGLAVSQQLRCQETSGAVHHGLHGFGEGDPFGNFFPGEGSVRAVRFGGMASVMRREDRSILSVMRKGRAGAMVAGDRGSRKTALVGVWQQRSPCLSRRPRASREIHRIRMARSATPAREAICAADWVPSPSALKRPISTPALRASVS
jgi:hypothetical protein